MTTADVLRDYATEIDRQLLAAGVGQVPTPLSTRDNLQAAFSTDIGSADLDMALLDVRLAALAGFAEGLKVIIQLGSDLILLRRYQAIFECLLPLAETAPVAMDADLTEALMAMDLSPGISMPDMAAPAPVEPPPTMCVTCGERPGTTPCPGGPPNVLVCDHCMLHGLRAASDQVRSVMMARALVKPEMGGPMFNRGPDEPDPPAPTGWSGVLHAIRQALRKDTP